MELLSPHFTLEEFDNDGPIPEACLPILERLCNEILEPLREFAGGEFEITSGYRPPAANAEAHGQSNSEHIYSVAWAAADGYSPAKPAREIFDWARMNPSLPFHQLILEHGSGGSSVIHVSINSRMIGVRSVLEGATHNAEPYVKIDHVAYDPQQP